MKAVVAFVFVFIILGTCICAQTSFYYPKESLQNRLERISKAYNIYISYDADQVKNKTTQVVSIPPKNVVALITRSLQGTGMMLLSQEQERFIVVKNIYGWISGRVIDENSGEPVKWANIQIGNARVSADADGAFTLRIEEGQYAVEVSAVGYICKTVDSVCIRPQNTQWVMIVLPQKEVSLGMVRITASVEEENALATYIRQRNAATVSDGIYRDKMSHYPSENNLQLLKRLNGVSVVQNKYITIRGLTERYTQLLVDGVPLSTTNFNRREEYADIIPKEVLSAIFVSKSATADQIQEFGGGQIHLSLFGIPAKPYTRITMGLGVNSQMIYGNTSRLGTWDKNRYWGWGDRRKNEPAGIQAWYRYLKEPPPPGNNTTPKNLTLSPTNKEPYSSLDAIRQSQMIDADELKINTAQRHLPNVNFTVSMGRIHRLRQAAKIGWNASVFNKSEQNTILYNNKNENNNNNNPLDTLKRKTGLGVSTIFRSYTGGIFNIGYLSQKVKLSFHNLFSTSFKDVFTQVDRLSLNNSKQLLYREFFQQPRYTTLNYHKLNLSHTISTHTQLNYFAAYNNVSDKIVDQRRLRCLADKNTNEPSTPNIALYGSDYLERSHTDSRQWLSATENNYYWGLFLNKTYSTHQGIIALKMGYDGAANNGTLRSIRLVPVTINSNVTFGSSYNEVLNPANMGTALNKAFYWADNRNGLIYAGKKNKQAVYIMADQKLYNRLRVVYGLRAESYNFENQQQQYSQEAFHNQDEDLPPYSTKERRITLLPSFSATYKVSANTNVRLAYYKTVTHPDYRESSYFSLYDFDLNANIAGRQLKSTILHNADLRWEWIPSPDEVVSISGYHKYLKNPVELSHYLVSDFYGYINQHSAVNVGMEIEARKSLGFLSTHPFLKKLFVFANANLCRSKVSALSFPEPYYTGVAIRRPQEDRPIYGQVPWVINVGASYNHHHWGASVFYNHSGSRTFTIAKSPFLPEYENGMGMLDFECHKKLFKQKAELAFSALNIFNPWKIFYTKKETTSRNSIFRNPNQYDPDKGDIITDRMKQGTYWHFSFKIIL